MKGSLLFSLKNIQFSYQDQRVIDIDTLEINKNNITVLRGPNGSGKTTLLKLLNRLIESDKGEIKIDGVILTDEMIRNKSIYLHQEPYLFNGTVESNLNIVLKIKGVNKRLWKGIARNKLNLVGLENFQKRKCHEISGGEKKRVALARALITEPEILFLDEPDANIDTESSLLLEKVLIHLRENGISIIMSTHSKEFAYRCGNEFIDIESGELLIFEENIFKGKYKHELGHYGNFQTGNTELAVPGLKGDYKCAVLSPDDVILSENRIDTSAQNQLDGEVGSFEKTDSLYSVALLTPEPIISHITEESFQSLNIKKGTKLIVIFKASAIKLY